MFVGILKVTDEKSRIRIRIRKSVARIYGSGFVTKMSRIHNMLITVQYIYVTGIYAVFVVHCKG